MDLLLLVTSIAIVYVGIAVGHCALTWLFFARHLIGGEYEMPDLSDASGLRKTRIYFLGTVAVGWIAAAAIGFSLHRGLSLETWRLCGLPFTIGWAFAMFAGPLRLWSRLRPWRT